MWQRGRNSTPLLGRFYANLLAIRFTLTANIVELEGLYNVKPATLTVQNVSVNSLQWRMCSAPDPDQYNLSAGQPKTAGRAEVYM